MLIGEQLIRKSLQDIIVNEIAKYCGVLNKRENVLPL